MQQQRTVIEDKRFTQEGENTVIVSGVLRGVFFLLEYNYFKVLLLCPMSESPSGKREGFQDNATRKKGNLLLTRVRAPAASNAVVQGQRALSPSCFPNV